MLGADRSSKTWMDWIATLEVKLSQVLAFHELIVALILEDEGGWTFELSYFQFFFHILPPFS